MVEHEIKKEVEENIEPFLNESLKEDDNEDFDIKVNFDVDPVLGKSNF